MKKSDLFKLIKQSIKEQRAARTNIASDPTKPTDPLGKLVNTGNTLLAPTDPIKSADGISLDDDGTTVLTMDTGIGCAHNEDSAYSAVEYGDLVLYAGNCDINNDYGDDAAGDSYTGISQAINDGWICCSSNNSEDSDEGAHLFIETDWGYWGMIDLLITAETTSCYCPFPVLEDIGGDDYLVGCDDDGAEALNTTAHMDSFLTAIGQQSIAVSSAPYGNVTTSQNAHTGAYCAGCHHDNSEGCQNPYTRLDSSVGNANNIIGCPAGGTDMSNLNPNDLSCCTFDVDCATTSVDGFLANSATTPIVGISPTSLSQITSLDGSVYDVSDPSAFNATYVDGGGCTFSGCDNVSTSINYLTVDYNGSNISGPTTIVDDGSCIISNEGCMDDGGTSNTDVFNDGTNVVGTYANPANPGITACNYNDEANVDIGGCDFEICAGCMDDGTNNLGTNRPATGFVGEACNYMQDAQNNPQTFTISDPDACDYTGCVGCMDADGTDSTLYPPTRPSDSWWNMKGACTYDSSNTNSDPTACLYVDCMGCMNPDSCNNQGGVNANLTVSNESDCTWDCYGCGDGVELTGFTGDGISPITAFSTNYTINTTLTTTTPYEAVYDGNGDDISNCVYQGCLSADDGGANDYSNFVCRIHPNLCEVGGSACTTACPGGSPMDGTGQTGINLGSFADDGSCTIAIIEGCTDPLDCNYEPLATGGVQTDFCTGQPATCVDCIVDATSGLDVPGVAGTDDSDECGCVTIGACNYVSTAATDMTINLYDQSGCIVPGDCQICGGTNLQQAIADPACSGCISSTACNYGWYMVNGQMNSGVGGPILNGTSGITQDTSFACVEPVNCQVCIDNVQPAASYDPNIGWTEDDPTCDGCAVPGACNYDQGASDDPSINSSWETSCVIPDDCNDCVGTPGPTNTSPTVPNPACDCQDVVAYECNNETNQRQIQCMTIDGDQPALDDAFKFSYKVEPSLEEGSAPIFSVISSKKLITEQLSGATISNQYYKKEPKGGVNKTFVVSSITPNHGTVKDLDPAICEDLTYQCYCPFTQGPSGGPGFAPSHNHMCMASTTLPANGISVFDTKAECMQSGCHQSQADTGWTHYDANGYDNSSIFLDDDDGNPLNDGSCLTGCKKSGYMNSGKCCNGDTHGNIGSNDWSCCGPAITSNCFIGDTLITMPDNTTRRIDDLKVDEIVKSEKETSKIIKIDVHEGEFDLYSINKSKHFVTEEHPFQTTEGWKAIIPDKTQEKHQIEALVLKVGDILIKNNGETEEIISLEKTEEKITTTVYNLQLDNEHVYYANHYLVHNGDLEVNIPLGEAEINTGGIKGILKPGSYGNTGATTGLGGAGFIGVGGKIGSGDNGEGNAITESKKLREAFKNEFMISSKTKKEAKLREAIRKILKNKKK